MKSKSQQHSKTKKKSTAVVASSAQELRVRVAWLYYVEGLTQQDTASVLGISRLQVTRYLAEARKRGEVSIQISSEIESLVEIQRSIEQRFGVGRVIIAPRPDAGTDATKSISFTAGKFISEFVKSGMTIGVGWGRTLYSTLPHINGDQSLEDIRVVSLLGGIAEAKRFNPAEFAWQFAEKFNGEGYLVPAPALVDSAETKHALIEHCGIGQIFELANFLDVALVSTGGIAELNTSYRVGHLSESDRKSLVEAGVVGDVLYNFINVKGELVKHSINDMVISVEIDKLKKAKDIVLISGGAEKVDALVGALRLLEPSYLITDELTAEALVLSVDD